MNGKCVDAAMLLLKNGGGGGGGVTPEELETALAVKADKVTGAVTGNLAALDGTGNLTDSGLSKQYTVGSLEGLRTRVDALYKLTQGQLWDTTLGDSPAYIQDVPAGGVLAEVNKISGRTVMWNQMVDDTKLIPESFDAYQKTVPENTVGAEIGSIGGRTVVWNILIRSGNFSSVDDWLTRGAAMSLTDNIATITKEDSSSGVGYAYKLSSGYTIGHKYYWAVDYRSDDAVHMTLFNNTTYTKLVVGASYWQRASMIRDVSQAVTVPHILWITEEMIGASAQFRNYLFVDLTKMFGSGNEPTTTDDPRIAAIEAYAALHPEYNAGSLLSAEVTSVVSKGADAETLATLAIPAALREFLADKGYGWSAGEVYNELNLTNKTYIQRVSSVDLGTLTWSYLDASAFFYSEGITERAFSENVICAPYYNVGVKSDSAMASVGNMSIAPTTNSVTIKIKNTDYTDAAAFKTAMSGVMLYYELAIPTEYDISSYLTDDNMLDAEAGGTLTFRQDGTQFPVPASIGWEKTAWTETLDPTHKYIYVEDGNETYISGAASQAIAGTDRGLIDITKMFGAGSEPADLTEKQSRYALKYRAENPEANAGELVSADVTKVMSFRNFWDRIGYAVKTGTVGKILKPGDQITVPISTGGATPVDYDFDVLGIDEDEPVDENLSHVLTVQAHDVLEYGSIPFDPAQYLFAVTAEACAEYGWPATGMPAGTYNITLDHGSYTNTTVQDGTYQFTTTQIVPVGGGIRHTQAGFYRSDGAYTKANLLAGTFITYAADRTTVLEDGISTTEGSEGTNLGTTSASNPAYKVGNYINFSMRQASGYGRWSTSFVRQYLNSDEATMTFTPATIWSRPMTTLPEGFLHKLPDTLKAVIGKVRKRYALSIADGYGYEDIEDTVNIATMLDMNFGENNSISEGPVSADGTVTRETPYTHWTGAENAGRIKYQGATPRHWWLGSDYPSSPYIERHVNTSGALTVRNASDTYGIVPSLHITGGSAAPLDVLEIPDAIQALEGYGESDIGSTGNTLDLAEKKFTENGHYVEGVWTALEEPVVTDVSAYLSDNALGVEVGGTVTFEQSNDLKVEVENEVEYLVKLEEVVGA